MYYKNSAFFEPSDEDLKIWRYMNFHNFSLMLKEKALHFSRLDTLQDKFEGVLSEVRYETPFERLEFVGRIFGEKIAAKMKAGVAAYNENIRKSVAVNCWHMNDCESDAMWDLYATRHAGIAVQSTFKNLRECLNESESYFAVIGVVTYVNYENDYVPEFVPLSRIMHKRLSFQHERELRAVVSLKPFESLSSALSEISRDGVNVQVDLKKLIEKVYVSPDSEQCFLSRVKSVMSKNYPSKEVVLSSLAENPKF